MPNAAPGPFGWSAHGEEERRPRPCADPPTLVAELVVGPFGLPSRVPRRIRNSGRQLLRTVLPLLAFLGIAFGGFFVVAAVFSFLRSIRKRRLLDRQTDLDFIRALCWWQFEELVAEAFRRDGYHVVENDQPGPDGGVDIRIRKDGALNLVQCKNWRSRRVGVRVVREVYGVLAAENAQQAFVVCSGDFTADARGVAAGKLIRLVDEDALQAMVQGVRRPNGNERGSTDMVPPPRLPTPRLTVRGAVDSSRGGPDVAVGMDDRLVPVRGDVRHEPRADAEQPPDRRPAPRERVARAGDPGAGAEGRGDVVARRCDRSLGSLPRLGDAPRAVVRDVTRLAVCQTLRSAWAILASLERVPPASRRRAR